MIPVKRFKQPLQRLMESEVNTTPTVTGFTPRADRLAETLSAENAQGRLPPPCCIFVAKYVP